MISRRVPVILIEPTVVHFHLEFSQASHDSLSVAQPIEANPVHLPKNVIPYFASYVPIILELKIAR
jgi:hypothetical protein